MNIPPKYEDVVAQLETERARVTDYIAQRAQTELLLEATLGREAALREELDALRESYEAMRDRKNSIVDLQQRLTSAEQREAEAREELLDLSRKLDVFYSRSHGIKNLSAIEDAKDKSKALQQRLTVAEQRAEDLKKLLCDVINEAPTGFAALKVDLANRVNDALKPAAEGEGS